MNVRELFDYNPKTGVLTWKYRPGYQAQWNTRWAGKVAGTDGGHGREIKVYGKVYLGHRIIWEWVHGEVPPHEIDHKNGNPFDNRLSNLRPATHFENMRNMKGHGKLGFKGVRTQKPGCFVARIHHSGVTHYLGSFRTAEEAHAAYAKEAKRVFGEFACTERR